MGADTPINVFINGWATRTRLTTSFAACITSRKDGENNVAQQPSSLPVSCQAVCPRSGPDKPGPLGYGKKPARNAAICMVEQ